MNHDPQSLSLKHQPSSTNIHPSNRQDDHSASTHQPTNQSSSNHSQPIIHRQSPPFTPKKITILRWQIAVPTPFQHVPSSLTTMIQSSISSVTPFIHSSNPVFLEFQVVHLVVHLVLQPVVTTSPSNARSASRSSPAPRHLHPGHHPRQLRRRPKRRR